MKIFGIDVREWAGLFAAIAGLIGLLRLGVINPAVKFITELVDNHLEPLKKAIEELTHSIQSEREAHTMLNKRMIRVEKKLTNHDKRIETLEGGDKK